MTNTNKFSPRRIAFLLSLLAITVLVSTFGLRAIRASQTVLGARSQIRMLIQTGGTIGSSPASSTFSTAYLKAIFGDNPQLLSELESVIQSGISDTPALSMGEVSAMVVTYNKLSDDVVTNVNAHVIGGFPLGQREPSFHKTGYFYNMLDNPVWNVGNMAVGMLGRDIAVFSREEHIEKQKALISSVLSGNILPFVEKISTPLHYAVVIPNPENLLPRNLAPHIEAILVKGYMNQQGGENKIIALTPSGKSANYALYVLADLKFAAELALKTKFKGIIRSTDWGPHTVQWWAYELVQASEKTEVEKDETIVRLTTTYERVALNAVLKTMERMGRDLVVIQMSLNDKIHPVNIDRALQSKKPNHYWPEEHRWGPNWPIAPSHAEVAQALEAEAQRAAEKAAQQKSQNTPPVASPETPSA